MVGPHPDVASSAVEHYAVADQVFVVEGAFPPLFGEVVFEEARDVEREELPVVGQPSRNR